MVFTVCPQSLGQMAALFLRPLRWLVADQLARRTAHTVPMGGPVLPVVEDVEIPAAYDDLVA
jgi:hypothetical protein